MTHPQRNLYATALVLLLAFAGLAGVVAYRNPTRRDALTAHTTNYQININTAGRDELCLLPRVGPKIADYIIEYRQTHGPFAKAEDLLHVRFIGDKTFERMRAFVTVD